ncbi:MAG: LysM peptidoglycan-binding domain-containing protein [Cyclobacteriaceae bacterium]|nr:LysM peptidoglycan-binding domain-containing protein [Cyclobacteriaceae bacterium]
MKGKRQVALFLLFGIMFHWARAATPRVPSQIEFANMKLTLTSEAVHDIQENVDALMKSERFFQTQLDLINLYFPIIERVMAEEGVPDDLKYLVVQESGLISDAVSTSNAVGFWQFKDFTGREVGLRIDRQVDERKNIVAATRGAALYLKKNYLKLDNWAYAVSAYQAGLGGVKKYVDDKYIGAKKMPITSETHWYFKKYLAYKIAFEQEIGGKHSEGLELYEYKKGGGKDLEKISREFKVETDLLRYYNKWLAYGPVPTDKAYTVLIPVNARQKGSITAQAETQKSIKEPKTYPREIKAGISSPLAPIIISINGVETIMATPSDNVSSLSRKGGISEKQFLAYNDMDGSDMIRNGELYFLGKKKSKSVMGFHVLQPGESLWGVSQQYGIRLAHLISHNRIEAGEKIRAGRVLWLADKRPANVPVSYQELPAHHVRIVAKNTDRSTQAEDLQTEKVSAFLRPSTTPSQPQDEKTVTEPVEQKASPAVIPGAQPEEPLKPTYQTEKTGDTHTVKAGDTFWAISSRYQVTIEEIQQWNNLTKYDVLRVGQVLYVSQPLIQEKPVQATTLYTVQAGDTMYKIASDHGMEVSELMDLNARNTAALSIGETLKVYIRN